MYTSFYNLHSKPFQISSDPAFMWFGEKHKEALATLKYGILDNKGFLLLTGDVGTGKTSLINSLIQSLSKDIVCACVPDPSLEQMDFFNYIAAAFGMNREFKTKGTFLIYFKQFLMQADKNNKKVLLIIDESQLLTQGMLEEIRLLSNIEKTDAKLINIFFVGQNEFNEILNKPQNRAVRQRLTLNYNIDPLTPDETGEYIRHRLKVAGTTRAIFNTDAVQEIFMYSGGFPRRINIICDHSLLSGYVKDKKEINSHIIRECAEELQIPAHVRNRDINGFTSRHPKPEPVFTSRPSYIPPPPKKPDHTAKNSKSPITPIIWGLTFLSIFILLWIFLLPMHFKQSVSMINDRLILLKNQLMPSSLMPDSLKPYFKPVKSESDQVSDDSAPLPRRKNKQTLSPQIDGIVSKPIPNETIISGETIISSQTMEPDETIPLQPVPENMVQNTLTQPIKPEPLMILPLPKDKVVVRFKSNSNDFTETDFEYLENFADILAVHSEAKVLITGYTDSEGSQNYNRTLSGFRANIVRSFLLGKGLSPDQIKTQGLGSENPIESNDTPWGRMMNRRVEIEVIE